MNEDPSCKSCTRSRSQRKFQASPILLSRWCSPLLFTVLSQRYPDSPHLGPTLVLHAGTAYAELVNGMTWSVTHIFTTGGAPWNPL